MNQNLEPLNWKKSLLWLLLATASFHFAYASIQYRVLGLFIFGYAFGLVQLTNQPSVRRAFYFGLAAGILCGAPHLFFFWNIFGPAAIPLWIVFAFWIGLFAANACGVIRRWGMARAMWLIPVIWTGSEYFRSELYYLKFSWLNIGYVWPDFDLLPLGSLGMYGVGFILFATASLVAFRRGLRKINVTLLAILIIAAVPLSCFTRFMSAMKIYANTPRQSPVSIAGIQMEFPPPNILPKMLNLALAKNTNAQLFVLSECTLDGPVPDNLKEWCRTNSRFLIVGGKEPLGATNFYNTAYVVGTNGEIVFQQVKSVPVQFFKDGLRAREQKVWDSPWGKIGICICYDLSYTRVTDRLIEQGAQLIINPTMDVSDWGRHEHELHSRVATVRAAEYGVPIFRVASSGVSQAVTGGGYVMAHTTVGGVGEIMSATLRLPARGSLPVDRYLAPACTVITGIVMGILLWLAWNDKGNHKLHSEDGSAGN